MWNVTTQQQCIINCPCIWYSACAWNYMYTYSALLCWWLFTADFVNRSHANLFLCRTLASLAQNLISAQMVWIVIDHSQDRHRRRDTATVANPFAFLLLLFLQIFMYFIIRKKRYSYQTSLCIKIFFVHASNKHLYICTRMCCCCYSLCLCCCFRLYYFAGSVAV